MIIQAMPYPASGGGTNPYGTHTYWRLVITSNYGDSTYSGLAEIEMRATPGGANLCTGGTPSVSNSAGGGSSSTPFNGSTSDVWYANGTDRWAQYQFASPVGIAEIAVTAYNVEAQFGRIAKGMTLQYSDDGSTFTDAFSCVFDGAVLGATRAFPQAAFDTGFARVWRINVTARNGGNFTYIGEIELRAAASGTDQTSPCGTTPGGLTTGRAVGPSSPWNAFDDDTATASGQGSLPFYVGFVSPDPIQVEEIAMTNFNQTSRSPKDFTLDWLDQDGATWHTQKTWTGITWASVPMTKVLSAV
jgi:hypothetical protein